MCRRTPLILFALVLTFFVFTVPSLWAERATEAEMELVCQNWLSYMVHQKGTWAGEARPRIIEATEMVEGDTLLASCFSISPRGFVVVPILKELPPVKAYSEEYGLDVDQRIGFPQLLREVLLHRIRLYAKVYDSLEAIQPPTGHVLLGREHKAEWERFLKSEQEFETHLAQGKFKPMTQVGPLLTTSWDQSAPYNNFCPMGDGGRCLVGCVATAAAQIMKYHNWPPSGTGDHTYSWDGDQSCGGDVGGGELIADFSDSYDWIRMPNDCNAGCTQIQKDALAELCYEVGVAFEMDYGVCGSGIYTSQIPDVMAAYHTHFRYDSSIDRENRDEHTAGEWFSIIQTEISSGRPTQYMIFGHSIVCDGWRDTGGQYQYHMNYGWGGPYTGWYTIDNLYCPWQGCDPMIEFMIRYIQPLPFAPAVNYDAGDEPFSVFCADLDGDSDLDLAVANFWSNNVSILKNNGDGTFQTKVDYGTGDMPSSVFCADLDGDLDLDLAVANAGSQDVSILKNNGDGDFELDNNYIAGDGPSSVFCADLDGDSDLDLAVANALSDNVSVLKNNGDGTFELDNNYIAGDGPSSVFCANLDGDLDLDLAVTNANSNSVSILMNNSDGTFQTKVDYGTGYLPSSVFCAHLDGDLDLDLAVANANSYNVSILENAWGTFQPKVDYVAGVHPHSVFCANLDGDLDLDLAVANFGSNNVSILKNNGDGTFQITLDYEAGDGPRSVFCADLDGDLDFDLAVANRNSDNVSILENLSQFPGNIPPLPFNLISPTDGDSSDTGVAFNWATAYDPNWGDQIRYDLWLSTSPGFEPESTIIYWGLLTRGLTDTLDVDTYYYWNVRAYDNWGGYRWASNGSQSFYVLPPYISGDANGDGVINVADVVYLVNFLYRGGDPPVPMGAGDANCDDIVNVADIVYLVNYLYRGGDPPGCP